MTVETLIRELADTGIRLSRRGDRLHVEATAGAITPDLLQRLADHKPELLAELAQAGMRDRLATVAQELGLPAALVQAIPDADLHATVEQVAGLPAADADALLRFYVKSLSGSEPALPGTLAAREAPARQARVVELRRGVTCGSCRHFDRDPVNPAGGQGRCGLSWVGPRWYFPHERHVCREWRSPKC